MCGFHFYACQRRRPIASKTWLPLAAIDEKSAAIVVGVRTILLDQYADILGARLDGLARTRWFSMAVESVSDLCCLAHQGRPSRGRGFLSHCGSILATREAPVCRHGQQIDHYSDHVPGNHRT